MIKRCPYTFIYVQGEFIAKASSKHDFKVLVMYDELIIFFYLITGKLKRCHFLGNILSSVN